MIYADNAATTQLDPDALEEMQLYLTKEYGNPSQPYSFSRSAKKALQSARKEIADCIGAKDTEVYFTSCGTESDNWAIKAGSGNGDIVTTAIEHHAILNPCKRLQENGKKVIYTPVDRSGIVSMGHFCDSINEGISLVSVMFANNEIGTIQDIKTLAQLAHNKGCLFHTDAVQAVGHISINVHELDVDLLSASAHKFNGPKGIGFLYIKNGISLPPFIEGGGQENGLRSGTENVPYIVGMAKALRNNNDSLEQNQLHLSNLENVLIDTLKHESIDFIRNGSANHIPGCISLSFPNVDGEMLLHRLDLMKIIVSTGSACDSKNTQLSHVIKAIEVPEKYSKGTIRISLGKYNTVDDVVGISRAIIRILKSSRQY